MAKRYKCPYCELRDERKKLITHIDKKHEEMLPEGYDGARIVYDMINHTNGHGTCRICKKDTQWNSSSQRYDILCGNPKCKEAMREEYKKNMLRVKGTYNILNDPEQQQKMLANRKISGKYKYSDGTIFTYTGSYEKKLLEFEDAVMNIPSKDIMMPGPTIEYIYKGEKHFYIADQLYIPYNLIIEIKDGGDNKNGKETPGMIASREKTIEKEKVITDKGEYNYLRLTNNDFVQLIEIFMELKENYMNNNDSKVVRIHEGTKSVIDSNYKPNGKKDLSSFKKVHITESVINKYKKEYPFLSHVRCKDTKEYTCDGYIWFDNNELVAMVGSCQYTDDKTKWVVSLEIIKKYRGYGLSKQILDYATKTMNCKYLSVNKNNAVAKKIYDEYGFKVYQEDKTMYYMTIDKNIKESLYSSSSDSESSIIESKSLEFKELLKTINTPKELSNWMKTNIHYKEYDRLMTANEVFDKKKGSCHDQVNFEVEFFKKFNLKYGKEFLIEYNEGESSGGRTHSFIWFTTKGKYYWFENAWGGEQGIHGPYDSIIDIKKEVKEKMLKNSRFSNVEFSSVKNVKPGMSLGEFVTSCLESTLMESMKNNNKLYFLSTINMNDDRLTPRIPSNYFTKNNYEENKTPRVCFAKTIDGCLMGLSKNLTDKEFYVHVPDPDGYYNVYNPTIKEVPDCKITGEVWIKKPVDLKCIGKIKVLKDTGEAGIPFKYGDKTAELYKWDWKWVDKYDNESINESTILNEKICIDPKVVEIANYINENFIFNEDYFNVKMEPINNNTYLIAEYIIGNNNLDMKKLSDSFSMLKERCNTDQYGLCMIKESNNNKYNLYLTDINVFKESISKGPKKCPKCGGKVGVFIQGEPIYKCVECGKYLGVVPCHLGKKKK